MAATELKTKLKVSADTTRLIRHSHPELKRKLKAALRMILNDPRCGKALREELKGLYSFRVGNIRIIYTVVEKNVIEIIAIGPRKRIYEETYILLKFRVWLNSRDGLLAMDTGQISRKCSLFDSYNAPFFSE